MTTLECMLIDRFVGALRGFGTEHGLPNWVSLQEIADRQGYSPRDYGRVWAKRTSLIRDRAGRAPHPFTLARESMGGRIGFRIEAVK